MEASDAVEHVSPLSSTIEAKLLGTCKQSHTSLPRTAITRVISFLKDLRSSQISDERRT